MEFATAKPTRPTKRTSSWRLRPRRKRLDDAGLVTARQSGKQVFKGGDMNNWTTIHQGISLGKLPSTIMELENDTIGKYWEMRLVLEGPFYIHLHPFTPSISFESSSIHLANTERNRICAFWVLCLCCGHLQVWKCQSRKRNPPMAQKMLQAHHIVSWQQRSYDEWEWIHRAHAAAQNVT